MKISHAAGASTSERIFGLLTISTATPGFDAVTWIPAPKCFASASMIPVPSPGAAFFVPVGRPMPSSLTDSVQSGPSEWYSTRIFPGA